MKTFLIAAALSVTATASMADSTAAIQAIVDKNLVNDQVSESSIRKDGTLYGVYNGARYDGTWEVKGGQYCRAIKLFKINGCQDAVSLKDKDGKIVGIEFRNPGQKKGNRYFLN